MEISKCMVWIIYIKKDTKLKISDVSIPLQKLETGQKIKSKDNRKKNSKDNSRINKIENNRILEQS